MTDYHPLGTLQKRVMSTLWSATEPLTIHVIHAKLNKEKGHPDLAYTTILTVCRNLTKHKYIDQIKSERNHKFVALVTQEWYQDAACVNFVDDVFNGDVVKACSAIAKAFNERGR